MTSSLVARLLASRFSTIVTVFVATYLVAGIPILHVWSRAYFKGPNLSIYQFSFVVAFLTFSFLLRPIHGTSNSPWRYVAWGAAVGFLAGVLSHGVADYSMMEANTTIESWFSTRVTISNLVILNVLLLTWLFGSIFGLIEWFVRHRLVRSSVVRS